MDSIPTSKLKVVDRGLILGDVVASASSPLGQVISLTHYMPLAVIGPLTSIHSTA
jgi:hypothetical protein